MKKIFIFCTVLTAALFFIACDNEDETVHYKNSAAVDAVGTYEGTWMAISSYTGDTTYQTGRMIVEAVADTLPYQCKVTIENDSTDWSAGKGKSALANVAHAGKSGDISFGNASTSGIGATGFTGRIYGDGRATFYCALTSKVIVIIDGEKLRKNVIVAYSFTGTKVAE